VWTLANKQDYETARDEMRKKQGTRYGAVQYFIGKNAIKYKEHFNSVGTFAKNVAKVVKTVVVAAVGCYVGGMTGATFGSAITIWAGYGAVVGGVAGGIAGCAAGATMALGAPGQPSPFKIWLEGI